ncbi:ABC transporter permease [Archaeoglobus neptunius]|uniref:ABC transporter permease n=1 Tax=Archaeoglobus neptunius TaxID=2798580 RepID=UPI0019293271|nr:ABC transporter permease [Archaeoglobus neptunius]
MKAIIVAKKEFADMITSKRFIILLAAMILLYLLFTTQMGSLTVVSTGGIIGYFGTSSISLVGGIFGLALGFDAISREKENGTLRTLLTHPVFRDEIVLGKAIAALLTICIIVFITVLVMVGTAAFYGYIPDFNDVVVLAKFSLTTVAYLFTFFSIAFFFSAILKSSSNAMTASFAVFILLVIILPVFSFFIAQAIVGPPPQPPDIDYTVNDPSYYENIHESPEWKKYEKESREYYQRQEEIMSTLMLFSPQESYMALVSSFAAEKSTIFGTVDTTKSALSFVIVPLALFTATYVRFTREEL